MGYVHTAPMGPRVPLYGTPGKAMRGTGAPIFEKSLSVSHPGDYYSAIIKQEKILRNHKCVSPRKTPVREANAVRFRLSDILGKTELWVP